MEPPSQTKPPPDKREDGAESKKAQSDEECKLKSPLDRRLACSESSTRSCLSLPPLRYDYLRNGVSSINKLLKCTYSNWDILGTPVGNSPFRLTTSKYLFHRLPRLSNCPYPPIRLQLYNCTNLIWFVWKLDNTSTQLGGCTYTTADDCN